jgi:Tol biopolymer transport system component
MKTIVCGLALVAVCLVSPAANGNGDSPRFSSWSDPVNLGVVVNSTAIDNTPCISRDGLSLYFYSSRPLSPGGPNTSGDLYVSQRPTTADPWGTPVNLGPNINTTVQEYWPTLSPDGHRLYFSRSLAHDGNSNYDLYVSRRQDKKDAFGWQAAVPVDELNTADFNDVALAFFEDDATGRLMAYFTSNRPGTADLFMTWLQDDDTFTQPVAVDELNTTANNERLATIRRDGLEVFFNRAPAVSGPVIQPIFTSTRSNTAVPWSQPVEVPPPVSLDPPNVTNIAPRLSFDSTELYFSSTRAGGFGQNDIWVSTRTRLKGN